MKPIIKYLFIFYLIGVAIVSILPIGGMSTAMNEVDVLSIRLDYLMHALVFIPLVPLWRLVGPQAPWWLMIVAGLLLAAATEAVQLYLPYRAYNINDMLGNIAGVAIGAIIALFIPKSNTLKSKYQ